jgi:hypothetical protein
MSHTINLPSCGGHHFTSINRIKEFIGCHFQEKNSSTNIINKEIILNIYFNPDKIYLQMDGCAGNCWTTHIKNTNNNIENIYNFRNFRDLVMYYEKKGYKFV